MYNSIYRIAAKVVKKKKKNIERNAHKEITQSSFGFENYNNKKKDE
jgi:hypothetical protein